MKNKITFMSRPRTTANDRRTWLVKLNGVSQLVRVYPLDVATPGGSAARFVCDCLGGGFCEHIQAAVSADQRRFERKGDK